MYVPAVLKERELLDSWTKWSFFLFLICLASTIISSIFFFENPFSEWIPAVSNYSPILLIFLLKWLDINIDEMIQGVVIVGFTAAVLAIVYQIYPLEFMEAFKSASGFGSERRVIFFKNELAFTIVLSFSRMFTRKSFIGSVSNLFVFLVTLYALIVIYENRVIIVAVFIAMMAYVIFILRGSRKVIAIITGLFFSLAVLPVMIDKYIDQLKGTSSFTQEDSSVVWRLNTIEHYQQYFDATHGFGFGIMSTGDEKTNIIAYSLHSASRLYGDEAGAWGLFLADISFFSVLFQFGYLGLIYVLFMNFKAIKTLIKCGLMRAGDNSAELGALGFLMMFLVVNPWPLNFFTLTWSMLSGNLLWFFASKADENIRLQKGQLIK
jgi:hypothetical protein